MVRQRYLGNKGLVGLIALLSAFVPLSTDLYLPALPGMAKHFGATVGLVNLTLIMFFVFFAAGTLFWGPICDRYGRKPALMWGLAIYVAASIFCAMSRGVYSLIAWRALQAVGGSAACTVATAMVKDVYEGRKRETVLALVQSMVLITPAVAPAIGAQLLKLVSWRGAFFVLAGIGVISMAGAAALTETIGERYEGTARQTAGRLAAVLANPGFRRLLLLFSLTAIPALAFIASASYIFMDGFGLSAQAFSGYFSMNAAGMILGPAMYIFISGRIARRTIINIGFAVIAVSGLLMFGIGNAKPWIFIATLFPASLAGSCLRTPGANLMLEQQKDDIGSAAALMGCAGILFGSIGMALVSLGWKDMIRVLGVMNAAAGLSSLLLWLLIAGKPYIKQIPEHGAAARGRRGNFKSAEDGISPGRAKSKV